MNIFDQIAAHLPSQECLTYVDVGAMGGVSGYWKNVQAHCRTIAFEPDDREFSKLKSDQRVMYLPYVLYHSSKPLKFYIAKDVGKSSIYVPNHAYLSNFPDADRYEIVKEVCFPKEKVKTLDDALLESSVMDIDFLKIDTQGSELDILKGGMRSLSSLCGVEVEVEFAPLYQGQALFRDVDAFLDIHGYELVDLRRALWKRKSFTAYIGKGQVVFGDALYLRKIDLLINDLVAGDQAEYKTVKIVKAVMTAMVYRVPDYAIELLNKAKNKGLISSQLHQSLSVDICREASRWGMRNLIGRSLCSKVFNRCAEILKPSSYLGWADGDRFIGNVRNI